MNTTLLPQLSALYTQFLSDDFYVQRQQQLFLAPIFKDIIRETLHNKPITNLHLSGLIQMFKSDCRPGTFSKYLQGNIPDIEISQPLFSKYANVGLQGLTGSGLRTIQDPSAEQLAIIKKFLLDAFQVNTVDSAAQLCQEFDRMDIPEVKKGVYSPWLYYINPKLFPIINNSHVSFKQWLSIPDDYPACIRDFGELKNKLNIEDFGLLDAFAFSFLRLKTATPETTTPDIRHIVSTHIPKNQILYGPPGTGKTYNSIYHALSILENTPIETVMDQGWQLIKARFDNYVKTGRIVFTTFHQSMSYEDFIEGIKPVTEKEGGPIRYQVEDGIFKQLCTEAAFSIADNITTPAQRHFRAFEHAYNEFTAYAEERMAAGEQVTLKTKYNEVLTIVKISEQENIWIRHQNSNKTYIVSRNRLSKLDMAFDDLDQIPNISKAFTAEIGGHNSSAYWAVLKKIKELKPGSSQHLTKEKYTYTAKQELIQQTDPAEYSKGMPPRYVMIIDEINRGNMAQIFGELITLLEDDKRLGQSTALTVTLPYSKKPFGVPPNLYVIGTMNTADRSVETLDTALRRRFTFVPYLPDEKELDINIDGVELSTMLTAINDRLRVLKDNDHTIGHAWFWEVDNLEGLKKVFAGKVLPLLQEFFFNDYQQLGLVLGNNFFLKQQQVSARIFARFDSGTELAQEYSEAMSYVLKPAELLTVADFQSIYQ
ncbi:McrB family protein [Chitinophaga sp. Hz27]|uniref:McrB family protein n=1 Tax=Chitinophaga sp. Hz27 TaxID=3347169 RepID=UPI0035DEA527